MSEYAERDIEAQGEYYTRHVSAMTREELHLKSDIAAELAHRDCRIVALEAENARLLAAINSINKGRFTDEEIRASADRIAVLETRAATWKQIAEDREPLRQQAELASVEAEERAQAAERRVGEAKSRFLYTANASQVDMHGWRTCAADMYAELLKAPNECYRTESTEQRIAELEVERDKAAQEATVAESMCAVHEQEIPALEEQVQVLSTEVSRLREELNTADTRYSALLEQNGQACVRAKEAKRAQAAEQRIAALEADHIRKRAEDLRADIDAAYEAHCTTGVDPSLKLGPAGEELLRDLNPRWEVDHLPGREETTWTTGRLAATLGSRYPLMVVELGNGRHAWCGHERGWYGGQETLMRTIEEEVPRLREAVTRARRLLGSFFAGEEGTGGLRQWLEDYDDIR